MGNIHSYESFATLDGGGIRFCVFMQGCPLRCIYCHNPDTQEFGCGKKITVEELSETICKKKNFYQKGGVTFSGGEPLSQAEFLQNSIADIKQKTGLHVAIDTSLAVIPKNFDSIIELTDLFIVDLKFNDADKYHEFCGANLSIVIDGIKRIARQNKKILLRTVVIPNFNDTIEDMDKYIHLLSGIGGIVGYELLGYHDMGRSKYEKLGREYSLQDILPMNKDKLQTLQSYINNYFNAISQ